MSDSTYARGVRALKKDPKIAPLVKTYGTPDLAGRYPDTTIFEALVRAIISQQISTAAARSIHTRVRSLFKNGDISPEALTRISQARLRAAGLSPQKISCMRDLAEKCMDHTIDESQFGSMTSSEIGEHLVQVKGIGTWTAHMILIFYLHRLDVLPTGDLAIRSAFKSIYRLRSDPSHKRMESIAKPWRSYASLASWYLWQEYSAQRSASKKQT
jgi:DNA-3-methyladenine glycosylase II